MFNKEMNLLRPLVLICRIFAISIGIEWLDSFSKYLSHPLVVK